MAEELQDLRARVQQLEAEKNRLQQERDAARAGSSARDAAQAGPSTRGAGNTGTTDRIIYLPRERKCPIFRGTHGIGVEEWEEEVRTSMRVRHVGPTDQASFLFDHLEGEARDEIKYRPVAEREDPDKVLSILKELYGCQESYVSLQEDFFSRRQLEGETLQEFSHSLFCLMDKVKANSPHAVTNSDILLRDQFTQNVNNSDLRRELKRYVRENVDCTLLDVRSEAITWEREGGVESKTNIIPSFCAVQSASVPPPKVEPPNCTVSQLATLTAIVQKQQEQLDQITKALAAMQQPPTPRSPGPSSIICHRCQQPGHIARHCSVRYRSPRPGSSPQLRASAGPQLSEN